MNKRREILTQAQTQMTNVKHTHINQKNNVD
jgi:hypothetical protein